MIFDTQVENEIRRRRRPETIFENTISMYYNQYCNSLSLTDIFPNIQKYCLNNGVWFHPESLLKYHVTQERIRLKRFPLSYVLNRNRKKKNICVSDTKTCV